MGDPPIHYGNDLPPSFSIFGVGNPRRDDERYGPSRGFFGGFIREFAGDPPARRPAPPAVAKPAALPAPPAVPKPAAVPPPPSQVQVWEWQPRSTIEAPRPIEAPVPAPEIQASDVLVRVDHVPAAPMSPPSPPVPKPAAAQPGVKQVCPVCMDGEPNAVLIPCGHMGYCMVCAGTLRNCPICRQSIRERIRTYNVAIVDE